jgi:hypothetical protein
MEKKSDTYWKLLLSLLLSFGIMYLVMFVNIDRIGHFYLSLTRMYMALLMVAPMAILMLLLMPMMYPDKKRNAVIMISAVVVFACAFFGLRNQWFISELQYMKAMIPHHSSAILTSKNASIKDPEVKQLAERIIRSQEKEIVEMKALLERLENEN